MSTLLQLTQTVIDIATVLPANDYDVAPVAPPGSGGFLLLMAGGKWLFLGFAVLALMAFGAFIGWKRSQGEGSLQEMAKGGGILLGVIVIAAAANLVAWVA